jgi:hypothetical protein
VTSRSSCAPAPRHRRWWLRVKQSGWELRYGENRREICNK